MPTGRTIVNGDCSPDMPRTVLFQHPIPQTVFDLKTGGIPPGSDLADLFRAASFSALEVGLQSTARRL